MTRKRWVLLLVVVAGIAAHSVALMYIRSHIRPSIMVMAGVIVVILLKHLGLLRPLYSLFRRRSPP